MTVLNAVVTHLERESDFAKIGLGNSTLVFHGSVSWKSSFRKLLINLLYKITYSIFPFSILFMVTSSLDSTVFLTLYRPLIHVMVIRV